MCLSRVSTYGIAKLFLHNFVVFKELVFLLLKSIRPVLVVGEELGFLLFSDLHGGNRWCRMVINHGRRMMDHGNGLLLRRRLLLLLGSLDIAV